ncbi:MAG: hypothetical protein IJ514_06090 [Clostridia bacterium]|nr:hypothetical protein [Clostridia bacterium]
MKTYKSKNASALKRRVKKAHSKSKFVGTLYLLGALAMLAFACLPSFEINGTRLWILEFWKPIKNLFNAATRSYFDAVVAILYAFVVLTALVNFLKCFSKLGWLSKRSLKYVNGYNKNMEAMETLGKLYSGSFGALVIFHFLIYVILPVGAVRLTMLAYAAAGVGLLLHFVCGLIGGTVSHFHTKGNVGEIEEEKRPCRMFVYFFRNLVQLAAVAAIGYYFVKNCNFNGVVSTALSFKNPLSGGLMKVVVPFALQAVILLCLLVLIKHATASTEYNRMGIEGAGMKNFRVFSFLTALAAGGLFAVEYFVNKTQPVSYAFAIVAGIAFVAFLVDCIFKSKPKEEEEPETVEEESEPVAAQPTQHTTNIYHQAPAPQPSQPVYVPVYYAYPAYAPVALPTAQQEQQRQAVASVEEKPTVATAFVAPQAEEPQERLNPNKQWKVRCPECAKELTVRETSPYHRCPACDKVFKLQKFRVFEPKAKN